MSQIGKPFKRYDDSNRGADWVGWFATICFVITMGFILYLCWFEQSVTFQRHGPAYTLEGKDAITTGYFYLAMLFASFHFVLMENPYRRLIYLILFIIWLIVVLYVHFTMVV